MLVIIKPTIRLDERQERIDAGMLAEERVGQAAFILADTNNTKLHACKANEECFDIVIQFLTEYSRN